LTNEYNGVGYYVFGSSRLKSEFASVMFGGRYGMKFDEDIFAVGSNFSININNNFSFFGDASYLKTEATPIFDFRNETHFLAILGGKYNSKEQQIAINIFYRNIKDPILLNFDSDNLHTFTPSFSDISEKNILGITGDV